MIGNLSQVMQNTKDSVGSFTDKATTSITTVGAETKNTLNHLENLVGESAQQIQDLATHLPQPIDRLNESVENLKTSVPEVIGGAMSTITEATNRAANTVKLTTEQATGALSDATNVAVHQLNDAAKSMTQTAEQTKLVLDETLQRAEQLSGSIANSVQDLVVTSVETWMSEHPIISWTIAHPLGAIALVLVTLFLGWGLLRAVAQGTQQVWLLILKAPLKLTQSLAKGTSQSLKRTDLLQTTRLDSQLEVHKRLPEILSRLEILRQEQDTLIKEMHSIFSQKFEEH
jgi:ElaB/YqjD/DUF883 family membrane-anchored ribosome-binding protein